ncbi:hypothetical protein [Xenorhabdus bharatensis]|uniref:hypothetical protein n=1 Tax=Xenorhabdus bharatensis TaxID=3136256 RepID=UPI0030F38804
MNIENILARVVIRAKGTFGKDSATHICLGTKNIEGMTIEEKNNRKTLFNSAYKHYENTKSIRDRLKKKDISYCHAYFTINKFKRSLTGNCQERSQYVFHELMKFHSFEIFNFYIKKDKNPTYIALCAAPQPYDHAFIMIHHPTTKQKHPLRELKTLPPEAWICDPWAEIICKGSQYPDNWKKKMEEWERDSHYVLSTDSSQLKENTPDKYNTLFSPLREHVLNAISFNYEFRLINVAFIDDKGNLYNIVHNNDKCETVAYNISEMNNMTYAEMNKYYK